MLTYAIHNIYFCDAVNIDRLTKLFYYGNN
nr:MAG TPA: hypothetical protein [Caudoviricetes sp.]